MFPINQAKLIISYFRDPDHGGHTFRDCLTAILDVLKWASQFVPADRPVMSAVAGDPLDALQGLVAAPPSGVPDWLVPLLTQLLLRLLGI